jgi:hypothetical protein
MEVELVESGFRLKSDDNDLIIYQTLPAIDEIKLLDDTPAVAGWIDYSGEQDLHLLIGILYGAAKPDSF